MTNKEIYDDEISLKSYLYRYESSYRDEFGDASVPLKEYLILEETDASYLIDTLSSMPRYKTKRVFKTNSPYGSNYAFNTIKNAKINYEERTKRYIAILKIKIERVQECFDVFIEEKND